MQRIFAILILAFMVVFTTVQFAPAETGEPVDPLADAQLKLVKNGLHNVQLAIERYGIDHSIGTKPDFESRYPHSLSQLVRKQGINNLPYIEPGFYHNPYAPGEAGELNAMQVPFGWGEATVGNFSYLTQYNEDGEVVAYVLVGYGPLTGVETFSITADDQPDGIIVTMTSGNVDHSTPQEFYDNGRLVEISWDGEV